MAMTTNLGAWHSVKSQSPPTHGKKLCEIKEHMLQVLYRQRVSIR